MQRLNRYLASLHFRLIIGFTLVLAVSLIGVSLYVRYTAEREIDRFEREVGQARAQRIENIVSRYYDANEGLIGIGPMLEQARWLYNWNIDVTDLEGNIVAASAIPVNSQTLGDRFVRGDQEGRPKTFPGFEIRRGSEGRARPPRHFSQIRSRNQDVASIAMGPGDLPGNIPEPPISRLLSAVDTSLLWTGLMVGIGGMLLVSLLSRRALLSVGALSVAARKLGSGDLSQRVPKLQPHEIGELGKTFNSMADDLQRAERQRLNLMADVAHELRTPLSNIQGYIEAMKDGIMQPNAETLDSVHQQVLHLNHLVEDVKLLSLMDAGVLRLNFEDESIGDVLRRSVSVFQPKARIGEISLRTEITEEFPSIRMDGARVLQVADNLIENAVRHTPRGGEIVVRAEMLSTDEIMVSVADNGEGIPDELIGTIFDRFRRADPSRTRATGGAGLGLSIAKYLVEAHGGTIRVESLPGAGTTFTFTIPSDHRQA
jgi:two-component system sensor histidine kinase BaeS